MPSFASILILSLVQSAPLTEVPFEVADDAIVVSAKINGKDVKLMFDTGFAGAFVIGRHVDLGEPTGKAGLKDFVGVLEADTIKVESLTFGSMDIPSADLEIVQMPTRDYTESYGTHVDGIMGIGPLLKYVTEINFQDRKFVIYPDTYDFATATPTGPAYETKMLPIGKGAVELAVRSSTGKNLVLALDTGNAYYATTHKEVLERIGLWKDGAEPKYVGTSYVASGPVDSWYFLMEGAKIFNVPVEKSVWSIIDLPSSSAQHDGTVGFGFLKNFNSTIDFKRRKVRLVNFSGKVADEPEAEVGITAVFSPKFERMVIVDVTPDGPAAKAGVKEGDFLLSVGDTDVFHISYRASKKLLAGPVGSTIEVAVSRGGQLKRLSLVRQLLVNTANAQTR